MCVCVRVHVCVCVPPWSFSLTALRGSCTCSGTAPHHRTEWQQCLQPREEKEGRRGGDGGSGGEGREGGGKERGA